LIGDLGAVGKAHARIVLLVQGEHDALLLRGVIDEALHLVPLLGQVGVDLANVNDPLQNRCKD
jgi:hypothetical protein